VQRIVSIFVSLFCIPPFYPIERVTVSTWSASRSTSFKTTTTATTTRTTTTRSFFSPLFWIDERNDETKQADLEARLVKQQQQQQQQRDKEAKAELTRLQEHCLLPDTFNPVEAGGWYNVEQLALNPKGKLVELVVDRLKKVRATTAATAASGHDENNKDDDDDDDDDDNILQPIPEESLFALTALLSCQYKGFVNSDLLDGTWNMVYSQPGTIRKYYTRLSSYMPTTTQKSRRPLEDRGVVTTIFVDDLTFTREMRVLRRGLVKSKVKVKNQKHWCLVGRLVGWLVGWFGSKSHPVYCAHDSSPFPLFFLVFTPLHVQPINPNSMYNTSQYNPVTAGFDTTESSKIVLRRIKYTKERTSVKLWNLPPIPVPLFFSSKKGGHYDFVYLDKDICVTRSNLGSIYIHFRPKFLQQQLKSK
jgi:hypothetical protein